MIVSSCRIRDPRTLSRLRAMRGGCLILASFVAVAVVRFRSPGAALLLRTLPALLTLSPPAAISGGSSLEGDDGSPSHFSVDSGWSASAPLAPRKSCPVVILGAPPCVSDRRLVDETYLIPEEVLWTTVRRPAADGSVVKDITGCSVIARKVTVHQSGLGRRAMAQWCALPATETSPAAWGVREIEWTPPLCSVPHSVSTPQTPGTAYYTRGRETTRRRSKLEEIIWVEKGTQPQPGRRGECVRAQKSSSPKMRGRLSALFGRSRFQNRPLSLPSLSLALG